MSLMKDFIESSPDGQTGMERKELPWHLGLRLFPLTLISCMALSKALNFCRAPFPTRKTGIIRLLFFYCLLSSLFGLRVFLHRARL